MVGDQERPARLPGRRRGAALHGLQRLDGTDPARRVSDLFNASWSGLYVRSCRHHSGQSRDVSERQLRLQQ